MNDEPMEPQGSCILCARRDPHWGIVCEVCRQIQRDRLDEVLDLWTHELPDEVLTGGGKINLRALDLLIPVPSIHSHRLRDSTRDGVVPHIRTVRQVVTVEVGGGQRQVVTWARELVRNDDGSPALIPAGDQTGEIPVLLWMDQWVRYWQEQRSRILSERLPVPTPDRLVGWLRNRVDWAADNDGAFEDFANELREQVALMRRVTGMVALPLPVPCPSCDLLTLVRWPWSEWEECRYCHHLVGPRRISGRRDPRPGEYDERVSEQVAAMEKQGGAA